MKKLKTIEADILSAYREVAKKAILLAQYPSTDIVDAKNEA